MLLPYSGKTSVEFSEPTARPIATLTVRAISVVLENGRRRLSKVRCEMWKERSWKEEAGVSWLDDGERMDGEGGLGFQRDVVCHVRSKRAHSPPSSGGRLLRRASSCLLESLGCKVRRESFCCMSDSG